MSETDKQLLSLARETRARAEEVLARAENFQDEHAQRVMRGIAASYEKLAERLEYEAGGADKR
jgi:hypothetical protein